MEIITVEKEILIQAALSVTSFLLTVIVALATYTWRTHTKSVDKQNLLLSSIDKNLALACQTIEQHSVMLEEGKGVHKELSDKIHSHENRISIIEAKLGFK